MATLSIPVLRHAIEHRDGATLASLYADNAVLRIIDAENPPSRPRDIVGHAAIADYYKDVCSRDMTHRVDFGVMSEDRLAFTQACSYPDGTKVFCSATLDVVEGKITRQVAVQAWDS